ICLVSAILSQLADSMRLFSQPQSTIVAGLVAQNLSTSDMSSRVENRRSDCSLPVDIRRGFRRVTSVRFGLVLFPVPAHRTGQADFPHPALGKDARLRTKHVTPSATPEHKPGWLD